MDQGTSRQTGDRAAENAGGSGNDVLGVGANIRVGCQPPDGAALDDGRTTIICNVTTQCGGGVGHC